MAILVAIGFAEALAAPEVAWSLVDAGYQVVAFSRKGKRPALAKSRYVTVHEITAPERSWRECRGELATFLNHVACDFEDRVILPLDDAALWLLNDTTATPNWTMAGPTGAKAELAVSKSKQIQLAREAGFNVPESRTVTKSDELLNCATFLPLILRPAEAVSTHAPNNRKGSNWICGNPSELERANKAWQGQYPLLVQPYLQGFGEGIFGLATSKGITALSGHRRLRMMNPQGSGSSACISQGVSEETQRHCESFVRLSGWSGIFMLETLRDYAGKAWFVEFNGRAWGSMALARRQGLEYPAWAVQTMLGLPIARASLPTKGVTCRNLGRELMHLLFVARGPKSKAIISWPPMLRSIWEVFRPRRRSYFYNWRRDDWKVFFYDCWATLRDQIVKPARSTNG